MNECSPIPIYPDEPRRTITGRICGAWISLEGGTVRRTISAALQGVAKIFETKGVDALRTSLSPAEPSIPNDVLAALEMGVSTAEIELRHRRVKSRSLPKGLIETATLIVRRGRRNGRPFQSFVGIWVAFRETRQRTSLGKPVPLSTDLEALKSIVHLAVGTAASARPAECFAKHEPSAPILLHAVERYRSADRTGAAFLDESSGEARCLASSRFSFAPSNDGALPYPVTLTIFRSFSIPRAARIRSEALRRTAADAAADGAEPHWHEVLLSASARCPHTEVCAVKGAARRPEAHELQEAASVELCRLTEGVIHRLRLSSHELECAMRRRGCGEELPPC